MRVSRIVGLGMCLAGGMFANLGGFQRGGFGGVSVRGGFGGGGFRGGFVGGYRGRTNFSPAFPGGFRSRFGFGRRSVFFGHRRGLFSPFGYYPYGYYPMLYTDPFWYDWGVNPEPAYGASYYSQYPPGGYAPASPQIIVIAPAAPAAQPPAPVRPDMREYGESGQEMSPREGGPDISPRPASGQQIYFLVPFKDKTVQGAVAYWVEGDTLHYITVGGAHRTASLGDIDRKAAVELNRGRLVPLRLPPAKQ